MDANETDNGMGLLGDRAMSDDLATLRRLLWDHGDIIDRVEAELSRLRSVLRDEEMEARYAVQAEVRAEAAEARCALLQQAIAWVMSTTSDDGLGEWERVTLTKEPNREDWFRFLPEMDYEVKGGTWDEPRWAFVEHPWFAALGLTSEECSEALAGPDTPADSQEDKT